MAENSAIEWTDHTFNPWEGCQKVGPGCDHCYAEARNARFGGGTAVNWGPGAPRRRTSQANWNKPLQWNRKPFVECMECGWRGEAGECSTVERPTNFHPPVDFALACPRCKHSSVKHARARVFCASLADWLDLDAPLEWFIDLLDLIRCTPNLDWLLLTKRIGNWRKRMQDAAAALRRAEVGHDPADIAGSVGRKLRQWIEAWLTGDAPGNVWAGTTITSQPEADREIRKLLAVPARVRFLSMEPLLGEVDLSDWLFPFQPCANCPCPKPMESNVGIEQCCKEPELLAPQLDWIITGGESGPSARPCSVDSVREIVQQCRAAEVPVLVKQLGAHPIWGGISGPGERWPADTKKTDTGLGHWRMQLRDKKGGDWSEWPEDLRVRQFPEVA